MSTTTISTRGGAVLVLDEATLCQFQDGLSGTVIRAEDAAYDAARAIWNGMIQRRPALIVRCASEADVQHTVHFVRRHDLVFSVRSGGHNIAGTSLCDGGVVVDLSAMKEIHVEPATRRVRVEPGCTLGDVDRATQLHGLAVPTGIVSETGIAGLTMGGGFGWLTRRYGYTSDNLVSARVVLPDGRVVTASDAEHPDLLWGIRGGGGNFGIVTSLDFQAYPLGPEVVAGLMVWPMDQAPEVMRYYRSFSASLPEEAGSLLVLRPAPPAPFLPLEWHGKPIVGIAGVFAGPLEEGARIFAPLQGVGRPLGGGMVPKSFIAHQTMFDAGQPKGRQYYWKSEYLRGLTEETDRILLEHARGIESPHTAILCFQLGGAMARISEDSSAAAYRDAGFVVNVAGAWDDSSEAERHTAWVRRCWEALRPHSIGTYVNFLTQEDDQARVRAAYGLNYDRLTDLKSRYDPENVLRANQNISPRAVPSGAPR